MRRKVFVTSAMHGPFRGIAYGGRVEEKMSAQARGVLAVIEGGKSQQRERVIALHCSGANASQWRKLGETLGDKYELMAPEHYGCASAGPWAGAQPFALADEAARTIALIDASAEMVHLVGHSYGGAVALHVALARPGRIASLTLYEPSSFHLLRQFDHATEAFAEIRKLALAAASRVVAGEHREAARVFTDYWNAPGAFDALRPSVQESLADWVAAVPLQFSAAFSEPTPASAYEQLDIPVLIVRGGHSPVPSRLIADMLRGLLSTVRFSVVTDAGHMGPMTHAAEVNALICEHIRTRTRLRVVAAA